MFNSQDVCPRNGGYSGIVYLNAETVKLLLDLDIRCARRLFSGGHPLFQWLAARFARLEHDQLTCNITVAST